MKVVTNYRWKTGTSPQRDDGQKKEAGIASSRPDAAAENELCFFFQAPEVASEKTEESD